MSERINEPCSRREFLRTTTRNAAAVGLGAFASSALGGPTTQPSSALPAGVLGRTKYPATLISYGAIRIEDQRGSRILKAAIDRGVNLVHTSASYVGGGSVRAVGGLFKADKRYRDKVFLCLKSYHPDRESEIDDMLRDLGTDHADVVLTEFHKATPDRIGILQAQQESLKKKGKVRHTGFVCHGDMNGVIELILEKAPDYFDVGLIAMRLAPLSDESKGDRADAESQRFLKNLQALRKQGLGILSMKSGAKSAVEKGTAVFQPHAKAVLEAGADSVLTSINTFDQVEMLDKLDLKSPHLSPAERKAAAAFQDSYASACLMCAECTKVCPQSLPVNDLMRIRLYHDTYGWHDHARREFGQLGLDAAALTSACGD